MGAERNWIGHPMLDYGWLTLKQAQEALKNGRLNEAASLLQQPEAKGHKRSWELLAQLATAFAEHGTQSLRQDDVEVAWSDLVAAEHAGPTPAAVTLRQTLTRLGITQLQGLIEAGDPVRAATMLATLRQRSARHPELDQLDETIKLWNQAAELADRGEFAQALQLIDRLRLVQPSWPNALRQFEERVRERQQAVTALLVQWHDALRQGHWREVLPLCDQLLAHAPHHVEVRAARAKAWKALEPPTAAAPGRPVPMPRMDDEPASLPQAYLLWIDGVGSYLLCLKQQLSIGQATPENRVDVPLFADVSRLHARLKRDAEGYLLEAARRVRVNGQVVERSFLRSGDRITLGSSCQLRFHQAVTVSTSARLDIVSGHRLPVTVDAVLLMADTLILGPGKQAHVEVPELQQPVVLHRHRDGLAARVSGSFSLNGQPALERGVLGTTATLRCDGCSFALEPYVSSTRLSEAKP